MDDKFVEKGLNDIRDAYKKLGYFDQYGATFISFILITFLLIVICAYCYAKTHIKPIVDDWPNQRCKPYFMPIAGFITKPDNISAVDYTAQNFGYCTQNILKSITGFMVEPITFITSSLSNLLSSLPKDINNIRAMFYKIRLFFKTIADEIMGRIMNIMVPLQQIIIGFRDFAGKLQGVVTAGLFTLLGSYYSLQSLMGSIAEFVIIILIALAALIVVFWLFPFTWGVAASTTALFVAVAVPLALLLTFLLEVMHVQPDLSIPTLKCFDRNTLILLKDGTSKKIVDIEVGNELLNDGFVTAKIKVVTKGSVMYKLRDVIVSDTHLVHYMGDWIRVSQHPESKKIEEKYKQPYLYCLNTESKTIYINNVLFSDWDEVVDQDLMNILTSNVDRSITSKEIHAFLDSGFSGETPIKMLASETKKKLKDVEIGDVLENGEKVYGVVEIDGNKLNQQYQCNLGKEMVVLKCAPNVIFYDEGENIVSTLTLAEGKNKKFVIDRENKMYHLITDKKTLKIGGIIFCDYNTSIDLFLEKV